MLTEELIIYRDMEDSQILNSMCEIMDAALNNEDNIQLRHQMTGVVADLIKYSEEHGFFGNLWEVYLTNLLVNAENAYSRSCEIGGKADGTIAELILPDMEVFNRLYHYDLGELLKNLGLEKFLCITDYKVIGSSQVYNSRIRDRICDLSIDMKAASSPEEMRKVLTDFYRHFGVGKLGLHKAFRIEENSNGEVTILPILKIAHVALSDLIGYESAKKKLTDNTDAFVNKRPANNCLLYGDAGTGKSSCIKAIANEYYDRGIRIVEVYRHQFRCLNKLIAQIKDRNYRFIIYMDDLSFEDFETEYKFLKAVIEGGLEKRPENVLIYATSNRRHLIKETASDRDDWDPDMHSSDTKSEKLSLSYRFGESIYFGSPDKKQFNVIVEELAKRNDVKMDTEELLLAANKWELSHGGLSGRTAQQFIDHLLGLPEEM